MNPSSEYSEGLSAALKAAASAAGSVTAAARSVWSACEMSDGSMSAPERDRLLGHYDGLTRVLDDEAAGGLLGVVGMTLADGWHMEQAATSPDRFVEADMGGRTRRLVVGACESVLVARKALWDGLSALSQDDPSGLHSSLFSAYESLGVVLQRDMEGGGILDFAGMRLVLGWPTEARVVKNLVTTSIYEFEIVGERFYSSPVMISEANSVWHSNVDNAQAHAADRLRKEAAS